MSGGVEGIVVSLVGLESVGYLQGLSLRLVKERVECDWNRFGISE